MESAYIFIKNSDLDNENKFLDKLTSHNEVEKVFQKTINTLF